MNLSTLCSRFCFFWIAAFSALPLGAQVTISPATVNFFSVTTGTPETLPVTLTNAGSLPFVVTDVNWFHHDVYAVDDTAFTIPALGNYVINVTCNPRHNLTYGDFLFVETPSQPEPLKAFVYAQCKYPGSYYDPTQNKSHEALKSALRTLLSTGTTDLGYNGARDQMFMSIDNQAVNGQGAAQNTLECIYTGDLAVGYTSRADCQTNDLFNTEHTFPQSLFGSATPMLSDLHHIFPTKDYANSERANKPFGVVSNPSWSVGGSKSNATTFEPRDEHKPRAASALLYMVLRYQDYSGFVAPQEAILRQWIASFPPSDIDSVRNEDIFALQHNRNPFIDHPEFLERIASVCTVDSGPLAPIAHFAQDTLRFGSTLPGNAVTGRAWLSNQGVHVLTVSSATVTGPDFTLIQSPTSIVKDSASAFQIEFDPTAASQNFTGTLTFSTNDPNQAAWTVVLIGDSQVTGIGESLEKQVKVFPNPATGGSFRVEWPLSLEAGRLHLMDLAGRPLGLEPFESGPGFAQFLTTGLPAGMYLLEVLSPAGRCVKPVLVP